MAMTTREATERHSCVICRSGTDCGEDCVRSNTCSIFCQFCGERVWFSGDLKSIPGTFECPYCGKKQNFEF